MTAVCMHCTTQLCDPPCDPMEAYLRRRQQVSLIVTTSGLVQLLYAVWCALFGHSLVLTFLYILATVGLSVRLYLMPRLG